MNTSLYRKRMLYILLLVPSVFYIISNYHGIRLTWDSYKYLECAHFFSEQFHFFDLAEKYPCPPLFTILLYPVLGDVVYWQTIINGFLLILTIGIWFYIAIERIESTFWLLFFCLLLIFSADLLMIHSMLWTEPWFLFLFSFQIMFLFKFLDVNKKKYLIGIIVFGALYSLQRRTGLFFNIAIVLVLIYHLRVWKNYRKYKTTLAGFLLVFSGFLLWEVYVKIISSGLGTSITFPYFNLVGTTGLNYLDAISVWFFPNPLLRMLRILLISCIMIFSIYYGFRTKNIYIISLNMLWITYLVLRLPYPRWFYDEALRYTAVFYPVFMLSGILIIEKLNFKLHILKILFVIWLLYPIARITKNTILYNKIPRSELAASIKQEVNIVECQDYCNPLVKYI